MSQMEKKAFLVVTSFLYYNSPGESIHTYIGIYKKELLLIYKFCVAWPILCQVATCLSRSIC